jgi:hypothetical protein
MLKRIFLLGALVSLALTSGCLTTNWTHNRRHFRKWREEIRQMHQDFDRIIFDLEAHPTEQ